MPYPYNLINGSNSPYIKAIKYENFQIQHLASYIKKIQGLVSYLKKDTTFGLLP